MEEYGVACWVSTLRGHPGDTVGGLGEGSRLWGADWGGSSHPPVAHRPRWQCQGWGLSAVPWLP